VIEVREISCGYSARRVLTHFSLDVFAGETLALVGPNSAGKSTLLKTMGGLVIPTAGAVVVGGRSLSTWSLPERARTIAWVPSEADFTFAYSVEEIVLLGRAPHLPGDRAPRLHDHHWVKKVLALTDLLSLAQRSVDELSSGEKQRLLLARALAQEPSVLLMDEPTAHLDIGHAQAFFYALTRLRQERALTVVLATHDLPLARRVSDRVALMRRGTLHALGTPSEVLTDSHIQTVFEITQEVSP